MKLFKFFSLAFAAALTAASFTACSSDDDGQKDIPGVEQIKDVHYDVWVSLNGTTGMGSGSTATSIIVRSVNSLEDSTQTIDFRNEGADITAVMDEEVISHGAYYYQANPLGTNPNYAKFKITNQGVQTIAERPFGTNTFKDRRYTHAWLSDDEFVIMAANGSTTDVIWTKIKDNGNSLSITGEGSLRLDSITGIAKYSTSGLVRYRKSDNTLVYVFQNKNVQTSFFVAFIDATTMKVKNYVEETRAALPAGTAYGELLQNKLFVDEYDNIYIAANTPFDNDRSRSTTSQYGRIFRINAGEDKVDESFMAYNKTSCEFKTSPSLDYSSKIITCDYLGQNKALLYLQDPVQTGCATSNTEYNGWGGTAQYNCYYAILDLTTDKVTELEYDGNPLPYSHGTFSQRSFVLNNKAYIGTNPKNGSPVVYVLDIRTGKVTKGAKIKEGYDFDRIVYVNGKL